MLTTSSIVRTLCSRPMSGQTRASCLPGACSMIMYSAPTGLVESTSEHQARTLGTGTWRTFLSWRGVRGIVPSYSLTSLTKSIVATSDAVVIKAGPALGFGTRAMNFILLAMVRLKDSLYDPSPIFSMRTQGPAEHASTATFCSPEMSNSRYFSRSCCSSPHSHRPLVYLKKS